MKRILASAAFAIIAIPLFAGTKIVFGTFAQIEGERDIPVTMDWKEAVYAYSGTLDDFLYNAPRDEKWESKSLSYFLKEANKVLGEYRIRLVPQEKGNNPKYRIVISTSSISGDGDIKGEILLLSNDSDDPLASAAFSSDERDDDDKIAFRDQLENIGENFGKLVGKQIKAQNKIK